MSIAWILLCSSLAALVAVGAIGIAVAAQMTRGVRRAPLTGEGWANLPVEHVRLRARNSGLELAGSFVAPEGATRAVVLTHGKDCSRGHELKTSTHVLVQALHASGLAVLMLDLRGHGESESARMSYGLHERHDVLGAVDWLRARGFAPERIGFLGASMGGACVIGALAADPRLVGPLVLDSTFADFAEMMHRTFARLSRMPRWLLPTTLWWSRRLLRADLRQLRPAEELARCARRPLLVVHARHDPFVRVDHAHALVRAGDGELWVTEGRHHLAAFRDAPDEYIARVVSFFDAHLVTRAERVQRFVHAPSRTTPPIDGLPSHAALTMR
jgi:alpha-beta hydrolase superfamily lysophospholipase